MNWLDAADFLTDARVAESGAGVSVAVFSPSLHLNLAECHCKPGDAERARDHLHRARAALEALPDDGCRAMIHAGRPGGAIPDVGCGPGCSRGTIAGVSRILNRWSWSPLRRP